MRRITRAPGWVLSAGMMLSTSTACAGLWDDLWWRQDQQAQRRFATGDFQGAAEQFDDPHWRAFSQYQSGQAEAAVDSYTSLDDIESRYNRATIQTRMGQYAEAIEGFEQVLAMQPDHADAAHNLEIARALLEARQQAAHRDGAPPGESSEDAIEDGNDNENADNGEAGDPETPPETGEPAPGENPPLDSAPDATGDDSLAREGESDTELTEPSSNPADSRTRFAEAPEVDEGDQSIEQWLRAVPVEDASLMENKLYWIHRQRYPGVGESGEPW